MSDQTKEQSILIKDSLPENSKQKDVSGDALKNGESSTENVDKMETDINVQQDVTSPDNDWPIQTPMFVCTNKQNRKMYRLLKSGLPFETARQKLWEYINSFDEHSVGQNLNKRMNSDVADGGFFEEALKVSLMHPDFPNKFLKFDQIKVIKKNILDKIDELPDDGSKVSCWFAPKRPGYVTVMCKNVATRDWVTELLKTTQVLDDVVLKVFEGDDLPVASIIKGYIKDDEEGVETPPEKILARIEKMNEDLQTENWEHVRSMEIKNCHKWSFLIDQNSVEALKKKDFKVCYIFGQIEFRLANAAKKFNAQEQKLTSKNSDKAVKTENEVKLDESKSKKLSSTARKRVKKLVEQGLDRKAAIKQVFDEKAAERKKNEMNAKAKQERLKNKFRFQSRMFSDDNKLQTGRHLNFETNRPLIARTQTAWTQSKPQSLMDMRLTSIDPRFQSDTNTDQRYFNVYYKGSLNRPRSFNNFIERPSDLFEEEMVNNFNRRPLDMFDQRASGMFDQRFSDEFDQRYSGRFNQRTMDNLERFEQRRSNEFNSRFSDSFNQRLSNEFNSSELFTRRPIERYSRDFNGQW